MFVFRPRSAVVVCGLWAVLTVVWAAVEARAGIGTLLERIPWMVFAGALVYAVCGRPAVEVRPSGVLLRNVVRDVWIPWTALAGLDTRYALTLTTVDRRRHAAWAAPASGRFAAARVTDEDLRELGLDDPGDAVAASATARSDSGAAAVAVRRGWARAREQGLLGPTAVAEPVAVSWAGAMLLLLVLSAGIGAILSLA